MSRLPTVDKDGKTWFMDLRLMQVRNVDDPHDYIDFESEDALEDWLPDPEE